MHDNSYTTDDQHTNNTNDNTTDLHDLERLAALGLHGAIARHLHALPEGCVPARVSADWGTQQEIWTAAGPMRARHSGRLRHTATSRLELPAVGDWVGAVAHGDGTATIQHLIPRHTAVVRKVAGERAEAQVLGANLDVVFVVTSMNQEFNLRRLERYLTTVWESGAEPVLVLSKADLADDPARFLRRALAVAAGAPVITARALEGQGVEAMLEHMGRGRTAALIGSSGVGKSTLTNALLGRDAQVVKAIRGDDDEGRHTTTHRQLFVLPDAQGLLLDTPGMRELQLWSGDEGSAQAFEDIERLALNCQYRDCSHAHEPGCAVNRAVDDGTLHPNRLRNYHDLQRELAYQTRRVDEQAARKERDRWKQITVAYRKRTKHRT